MVQRRYRGLRLLLAERCCEMRSARRAKSQHAGLARSEQVCCRKKKEYCQSTCLSLADNILLTAASIPSPNYYQVFFWFFILLSHFMLPIFPDYGERERPAFLCAYVAS